MKLDIHYGDIGTVFKLQVKDRDGNPFDLSQTTVKQIKFKKPSGEVLVKNATFETTGVDGSIYYTTVAGDLDETGIWEIQVYVEFNANLKYHTSIHEIEVEMNVS